MPDAASLRSSCERGCSSVARLSAVASAEVEARDVMEKLAVPDELALADDNWPIGLAGVDVRMKVEEEGRG